MEKADIDAFKKQFRRVRPGKRFRFVYFPRGADGKPLLKVNKRLTATEVRAMRAEAKEKRFVKGEVSLSSDRKTYAFHVKKRLRRMERDVRKYYGKFVPKLKRAVFLTPEDEAAPPPPQDDNTTVPGGLDALPESEALVDEPEESTADLDRRVASLRERLAIVQRQREDAEVAQLAVKRALDETTSRRKRTPLQSEMDDYQRIVSGLLEEENAIRAELDMAAADQEVRQVSDVDTDDIDASSVDTDALEAQQQAAEAADRAAAEATAALREKEARLAAMAERRRSAKIAASRSEDARARATVAEVEAEEQKLRAELETLRSDVSERARASVAARARAETMLDLWDESVAAHWAKEVPPETIEAVEEANVTLLQQREATRSKRTKLRETEDRYAAEKADLEATEDRLAERLAELESLQRLQERVRAQLDDAGVMTNTDGLEKRRDELTQRLAELGEEIPALVDEAEALHETVGQQDTEALSAERVAIARARQDEADARLALNQQVLSEPEQARLGDLQASRKRSHDRLDMAQLRYDELEAEEKQLRDQLFAQEDARRAFEEAHKLLTIAQLKHNQLAEVASKHRGLRFRKSDRQAIDEARAALPEAELELEAARAAFDDARKALVAAEGSAPAVAQQRLVKINLRRLEAQEGLAARKVDAAESDQRISEEDARVAALVEDMAASHHKAAFSDYLTTLPEEETRRLSTAQDEKKVTQAAATAATMALADAEAELADRQAELADLSEQLAAGTADPEQLAEKLAALEAARDRSRSLQDDADRTSAAMEAARKEARRAKAALLRGRAKAGDEAAAKLLAERDRKKAAKARSRDAAMGDAAALGRREAALEELSEARRAKDVAAQSEALRVLMAGNQGLVDQAHQLGDPETLKGSHSFDLLSDDGRKAAKKALGDDGLERLLDFQAELEQRAIKLIRDGATFEELTQAFARIPNGLRPPSYRAEAAAFAQLESAFEAQDQQDADDAQDARILELARSEMSEEELRAAAEPMLRSMGTTWDEFYGRFNSWYEKSGAKAGLARTTRTVGKDTDRAAALSAEAQGVLQAMNVLGVAVHSMNLLKGTGDVIANRRESSQEADPIKKRMLEDELMDKLSGMFSSGLKLGRDASALAAVGPAAAVLGTLAFGEDLAEHAMEIAARRAKQKWDGLLGQAARLSGSPLASSFEESLNREQRLITELGVDIALDSVRIAASISQAFPPAAVIGLAVQVGAWAAQQVVDEVAEHHDAKLATKAKQLLDAARAGDDAAKTELFKHHPRYAKGLIAHMAYTENDPYALMYTRSRGLKDSDIERSSMDIITRYLLKQSKQVANPKDLQDFSAKWRSRRDTAQRLLTYAIPGVGQVKAVLDAKAHFSQIKGAIDPEAIAHLEQTQAAARDVLEDRQAVERVLGAAHKRLSAATTPEKQRSAEAEITALKRVLGDYEALFRDTLQQAGRYLHELAALQRQLSIYDEAGEDSMSRSERQILADARAWLDRLRTAEAGIVHSLARAA